MDTKEVLTAIRGALAEVQNRNQHFVFVPALLDYLTKLETEVPADSEVRKLQHESYLAERKAGHETNLEMLRSVISTGRTALTTAILVNGGAAAAMLTFIGALMAKASKPLVLGGLADAAFLFGAGVLFGAIATGSTFISQAFYAADSNKLGSAFRILTIGLVVLSYMCFGWGISSAAERMSDAL